MKTIFMDGYIFGWLCAPQSVTLGKCTVVFNQMLQLNVDIIGNHFWCKFRNLNCE